MVVPVPATKAFAEFSLFPPSSQYLYLYNGSRIQHAKLRPDRSVQLPCILYDAVAGGFTDSSGLLAFRFNFHRSSFTQPRDTSCPPSVQLAISNKEMEKRALATSAPRSP